jgi:hypothetical protein
MTALAASMNKENQQPNANTKTNNNNRKAQSRIRKDQAEPRNTGGYCHTHGYHPVGLGYNRKTCQFKKNGHKDEATWSNRMGRDTNWPKAIKVTAKQQKHATWKGQAAPTN